MTSKSSGSYSLKYTIMDSGSGVTATFGADAKQTGAFALLHRFAPTDPAQQVLSGLIASWQLPRQVSGPADLRPGTWLIAELDGSLSHSLGVQYSFSPEDYKGGDQWNFYDRPLVANYSAFYRMPH